MITLHRVSKDLLQRTLFKDVNFGIFPGEKIGLTGPNGSGKSTLFGLILGEVQPSSGEIRKQKNIHIGYLPQESAFSSEQTVMDEVTSGDVRIKALLREKARYEESGRADSLRYGDILDELERAGYYQIEHRAEKVLAGLGFQPREMRRPVNELSGGWQMRTLLARLLIYPYDILLLDEPTNYLDLSATVWLKDFLRDYTGTFVLISHDRVFLDDVTNYTLVLENGRMNKIKGNYSSYEAQKHIQVRTLEKQKKKVEKRKQQLERFTQRFHAQPNRAAAVRNKRKMIERLQEVELPPEIQSIGDFDFPQPRESGYTVCEARAVGKAYGAKIIYENLNLEITRGQKICLVGPNGAGKSTLLKMLAGVLAPDSGEMRIGHRVQRGYFSQTRLDVLNPTRSVLEELGSAVEGSFPQQKMRDLLGVMNFRGDDVFKPVSVLSGGEKSRLILAKLLINPPNFLLLDEPTTHLDLDGVTAITKAFQKYQGTLCFISHDLYFVREIAETLVEVQEGNIKTFPGGLNYYLEKKGSSSLGPKVKGVEKSSPPSSKEKKKIASSQRENQKITALHRKHKEVKKRLNEIRNTIQRLGKEMEDLETESYVKARFLSKAFGKDPDLLKEYGQRLKAIPKLQRKIAAEIKTLESEKKKLSELI